jgi:prepilin-type N-terminal cleavage/methylation domain-containing protein
VTRFLKVLAAKEEGYTLVELLVVMVILGTVLAGLTTVFVGGSNAEIRLNQRFQAQQQARLALDRIRTDIHCASAAQAQTIGTYAGSLKLAETSCYAYTASVPPTPTVSWCPVSVTATRYQLYRSTATSNICTSSDATRVLIADYLTTSSNVFTTAAIPQNSLQTVGIDFKVSANTKTPTRDVYELTDSIVVGNYTPRCNMNPTCAITAVP